MNASTFVHQLRSAGLLDLPRVHVAVRRLATQSATGASLAHELRERNLLTAFQSHFLLAGKGQSLRIGPYRLMKRLDGGRSAHTFKAMHARLRRPVVLRVSTPQFAGDPPHRANVEKTMLSLARFSHANFLTVVDAIEVDGCPVMAFEYVHGIPLLQLLQISGRLALEVACNFVRQIAMALQHADERGETVRLLNPDQILVTGKRTPVGIDARLIKLRNLGAQPEWENLADFEHFFAQRWTAKDKVESTNATGSNGLLNLGELFTMTCDIDLGKPAAPLAELIARLSVMPPADVADGLAPYCGMPAVLTATQFTEIACRPRQSHSPH